MIKKVIKFFLPKFIIKIRENFLINKKLKKFSEMEIKEIFSDIYLSKYWTPEIEKKDFKFYSGIGSHYNEFTNLYIEKIKDFIQTLPQKPNVVDLGCGSGDIIIDFCKRQKTFKGVGLDISKSALKVAKINVKKNKLSSRIDLIHGDMKNPSTYSSKLKSSNDKLAFNAIMALHEFLIDGEEAVINILKKMKKKFPGSYFVLGEFNKASHLEFQKIPIY